MGSFNMVKDVFFTWDGIGDNLILLGAAYNYYLKYGEKPLIGTDLPFIQFANYATHIRGLSFRRLNESYDEVIENLRRQSLNPIFITASGYQYLAPSYSHNVTTWTNKHMITRYCERMGISGEVQIEIPLEINEDNEKIAQLSNYVCVMCGGLQHYKFVYPATMQAIVNYLKQSFQVVQLGSQHDMPLDGVLDYRNCSLTQAFLLLKKAKFYVGAVGGLIHLARAAQCKTVVLQSTGEPECLTKYQGNIQVKPIDICNLCARNLLDPQHQRCPFEYRCIRNITSERVISEISKNLDFLISENPIKKQLEMAVSDRALGLEDYFHTKKTLSL